MSLFQLFTSNPLSTTALILYLVTIFTSMRLVSKRKYGPDRLMLGILGLTCVYEGVRILQELKLWSPAQDLRWSELAGLTVGLMYMVAVQVVARWSREHHDAKSKLETIAATLDDTKPQSWPGATRDVLLATLDAIPVAIRIDDGQQNTVFANPAAIVPGAPSTTLRLGEIGNLTLTGSLHPSADIKENEPEEMPCGSESNDDLLVDDPTKDRRHNLRLPVEQPVRAQAVDAPDWNVEGRTRDFSGSGIGLLLPQPIPPGAVLVVHLSNGVLLGQVSQCRPQGANYRIGLRIDQFLMEGESPEPEPESKPEEVAVAATAPDALSLTKNKGSKGYSFTSVAN